MSDTPEVLPNLEEILQSNPGWLDEAINSRDAAKLTGVPVCTLATWRSRGGGPRFLKLGKSVRYRRRSLFEWMKASERRNTADTGETRA